MKFKVFEAEDRKCHQCASSIIARGIAETPRLHCYQARQVRGCGCGVGMPRTCMQSFRCRSPSAGRSQLLASGGYAKGMPLILKVFAPIRRDREMICRGVLDVIRLFPRNQAHTQNIIVKLSPTSQLVAVAVACIRSRPQASCNCDMHQEICTGNYSRIKHVRGRGAAIS